MAGFLYIPSVNLWPHVVNRERWDINLVCMCVFVYVCAVSLVHICLKLLLTPMSLTDISGTKTGTIVFSWHTQQAETCLSHIISVLWRHLNPATAAGLLFLAQVWDEVNHCVAADATVSLIHYQVLSSLGVNLQVKDICAYYILVITFSLVILTQVSHLHLSSLSQDSVVCERPGPCSPPPQNQSVRITRVNKKGVRYRRPTPPSCTPLPLLPVLNSTIVLP